MSDSSARLAYSDIYGKHVDDLSWLRVLDEAAGNHAHDLRQEQIKCRTNTDSCPLSAYLNESGR